MSEPVFIDDGATFDGYVAEVPRLHGAVRFRYRPLHNLERATVLKKIEELPPSDGERISAQLLARQLVEWDVRNKGNTVNIDAANVLKLHNAIFHKMYYQLVGLRACDVDPCAGDVVINETSELDLEAMIDGSTREEVLAGNSDGQSG